MNIFILVPLILLNGVSLVSERIRVKLGLLVGRPPQGKALYTYVVLPKGESVDALETSLPHEVYPEMFTVNQNGVARFLKGPYLVKYIRKDSPSPQGGFIHQAVIQEVVKRVDFSNNNVYNALKEVDDQADYSEIESDRIDASWLANLSRSVGAGAQMPKRFLATQVVFNVEKDNELIPVIVNLAEAYLFLQDNAGLIKSIVILPKFKTAFIETADAIDYDDFRLDVVARLSQSVDAFYRDYYRSTTYTATAEEE